MSRVVARGREGNGRQHEPRSGVTFLSRKQRPPCSGGAGTRCFNRDGHAIGHQRLPRRPLRRVPRRRAPGARQPTGYTRAYFGTRKGRRGTLRRIGRRFERAHLGRATLIRSRSSGRRLRTRSWRASRVFYRISSPDTGCLLLSERLEGELLPANTGLGHEAPLTGGKDRHTFLVFGVSRRVLRSRHRADLSREC